MRVLVVGTDQGLVHFLRRELSAAEFQVLPSLPGAEFVRAVRQAPPDIAVIDRAHARRDVAEMEVALLRDARREARMVERKGVTAPGSEQARCRAAQRVAGGGVRGRGTGGRSESVPGISASR